MIELLKSAAPINVASYATPANDQGQADSAHPHQPEQQPSEAATLSAAIQRLISERDTHKARAGTQEMELTRLRAVNEELRRQHEQIAAARDHYMRLATEMLTTLKHIDSAIHELLHKAVGVNSGVADSVDDTLMSLARRLSPKGAANDHAELRP
jgi:hypothetical protein